jgi:small subunit ribosomal protein S15
MARMHSRKKGKAGSKKPIRTQTPSWNRYKPKEVELLIVKLAKEGLKPSQIGMHLRDTYGIPDSSLITHKTVSAILEEKHLLGQIPEDLFAMIRKAILIKKHIEENKQDMTAKLGLQLAESKVKRLVRYYKKSKRLPADWKYDPEKIKIYVQ